eukprot:2041221-Rhodomonas_salina.2
MMSSEREKPKCGGALAVSTAGQARCGGPRTAAGLLSLPCFLSHLYSIHQGTSPPRIHRLLAAEEAAALLGSALGASGGALGAGLAALLCEKGRVGASAGHRVLDHVLVREVHLRARQDRLRVSCRYRTWECCAGSFAPSRRTGCRRPRSGWQWRNRRRRPGHGGWGHRPLRRKHVNCLSVSDKQHCQAGTHPFHARCYRRWRTAAARHRKLCWPRAQRPGQRHAYVSHLLNISSSLSWDILHAVKFGKHLFLAPKAPSTLNCQNAENEPDSKPGTGRRQQRPGTDDACISTQQQQASHTSAAASRSESM